MATDTTQYGAQVANTLLSGLQVGQRFAQMRNEAALSMRAQELQSRRLRLEEAQFRQELNPNSLVNKYRDAQVKMANARIEEIKSQIDLADQAAERQRTIASLRPSYRQVVEGEKQAALNAIRTRQPYTFGSVMSRFVENNSVAMDDKAFVDLMDQTEASINGMMQRDKQYLAEMDDLSRTKTLIERTRLGAISAFERGDRPLAKQLEQQANAMQEQLVAGTASLAGTFTEVGGRTIFNTGNVAQIAPLTPAEKSRIDNIMAARENTFGQDQGKVAGIAQTLVENPDIPITALSLLNETDTISIQQATDPAFLKEWALRPAPAAGGGAGEDTPRRRWGRVDK